MPAVDDADWQLYEGGCIGDAAALTGVLPGEDVLHIDLDSKAMRRYEQDDETLGFVFSNLTGVAGDDLLVCAHFSILVKE